MVIGLPRHVHVLPELPSPEGGGRVGARGRAHRTRPILPDATWRGRGPPEETRPREPPDPQRHRDRVQQRRLRLGAIRAAHPKRKKRERRGGRATLGTPPPGGRAQRVQR